MGSIINSSNRIAVFFLNYSSIEIVKSADVYIHIRSGFSLWKNYKYQFMSSVV